MAKSKKLDSNRPLLVGTSHSLHIFDDPAWLLNKEQVLQWNAFLEALRIMELGSQFDKQLQKLKPRQSWQRKLDATHFFRVVDGNYSPISISGTLASGGRFNVGGAQARPEFPQLKKAAGLYVSTTIELAQAEYDAPGIPGFGARRFRLADKRKTIRVFDLDKVVQWLHSKITIFPKPLTDVIGDPMAGSWEFVKYPRPSQILGHWLRKTKNAEGIIWRSVHHSNGENVFLFFKDEREVEGLLSAEQIQ
jgi:hypothetical protein